MNIQCSGSSRSFAKERRALKMRSAAAGQLEVDNDQLRAIIEADPLKTTWEVAKKLDVVHSVVVWHLKQIGRGSINGCLMSWSQIKKIIVWNCHLLLFYATMMNHFLIRLLCETKHGSYTRTSNDQLSGWTKRPQSASQSQTCTKSHSHRPP